MLGGKSFKKAISFEIGRHHIEGVSRQLSRKDPEKVTGSHK